MFELRDIFGIRVKSNRKRMETGYNPEYGTVWLTMANGKKETRIDLIPEEAERLIKWLQEDLESLRNNQKIHGVYGTEK